MKIYFRADGNTQIGLGHVIRSLALAEMLKQEFECIFIIQKPSDALQQQILKSCHDIIALSETKGYLSEVQHITKLIPEPSIVVLDGYFFKTAYQQGIKSAGHQLVFIDDLMAWKIPADVIVNHSGIAKKEDYQALPLTQFCLGLKYALLRSPFLQATEQTRLFSKFNTAFICLGGADLNNDTIRILKKIERELTNIKTCIVITGSAYPHLQALKKHIEIAKIHIQHRSNLTAQEMVEAMQASQIGICSASGISYEYMSVKGGLFILKTADNQKDIYKYLIANGLADDIENLVDSYPIQQHIEAQQQVFDGQTPQRFQKVFRSLAQKLALRIRQANIGDLMTYFHWANDSVVRLNAIQQAAIPLKNHRTWFTKKINSSDTLMYIFSLENGEEIGQVRFYFDEKEAEIGYSLDKNYRGQGWGKLILEQAISEFIKTFTWQTIIGKVKENNVASIRCFQRLNFTEVEKEGDLRVFKLINQNQNC